MSMQQRRVRPSPRISAQKLGEYLSVATAHRRERIIRDQKYQSTFKSMRYSEASSVIRTTLLSGEDVPTRLIEKARLLEGRGCASAFRAEANASCIHAIRRFARLMEEEGLGDMIPVLTGAKSFMLDIEDVTVSVAPTVLLTKPAKDGTLEYGALLLLIRKESALDEHGAEAVAELLRRALDANGVGPVNPKLCVVIDVFSGLRVHAPARSTRLMGEINSACREIAVRWASIQVA